MSELSRTWQLLLKGLGEVMTAALPLAAAEMVLIRIAYAADLPTPAELIGEIKAGGPGPGAAPGAQAGARAEPQPSQTSSPPPQSSPPPSPAAATVTPAGSAQPARTLPAEDMEATPAPLPEPVSAAPPESAVTLIQNFRAAVELAAERREMTLYAHLIKDVHLVHFEAGRIEIRLGKGAPRRLPNQLGEFLTEAAETRWVVSVSDSEGEPTLQAQAEARADGLRREAAAHPLVREIIETFPGAKIRAVRDLGPGPGPGYAADAGEESPDGEETPLRENGGPDE
jgi:DNA polymerase-3 subunit gamma/tau